MGVVGRGLELTSFEKRFAFHPKCYRVRLVYLAFANGILFFSGGDVSSIELF